MDWSLVAGPAHCFRLVGGYLFPLFFLSSCHAQGSEGKFWVPLNLPIGAQIGAGGKEVSGAKKPGRGAIKAGFARQNLSEL